MRLIFMCPSLSYRLNDVTADIVCNHPVCIRGMMKQKVASEHFEGEVY